MKTIQILLTTITLAAAGPYNYDYLDPTPVQDVNKSEVYSYLQQILNKNQEPGSEDYIKQPFISKPKEYSKADTLSNIGESIYKNSDILIAKEPVMETNGQIFDKTYADKETGREMLMRGLLRDAKEPKQTIRLDIPGYTVVNIDGQPRVVKQTDLLRGDSEHSVRSNKVKSTIKVSHSDLPANQDEKLALLELYVNEGYSIPRLANGNIDWATIVKKLKEDSKTDDDSSESAEEEDAPPSSLNEKLLSVIKRVKDSVLKLPQVGITNVDWLQSLKKVPSEETNSDASSSKSGDHIQMLKNYLASGGSIPFVTTDKSAWDGFLNTILRKKEAKATQHADQDDMALYKQYQKLHGLKNSEQEPNNKEEVADNKPVTNENDIVIDYDSLSVKDLEDILKDISKSGMTTEEIIKYLRNKQHDIVNNRGEQEHPRWDLKADEMLPEIRQKKDIQVKTPFLPPTHWNYPAKYNY